MAQQNTGLGWSAKEDWLIQGSGATIATLKKFGGSQFPGQPLAQAETAQDVINNGLCAVIADNWKYYFASPYGGNTLIFSVPSENKVYYVSETVGTVLLLEEIKPNGGLYPATPIEFSTSAINPQYGFAWARVTISGRTFNWQSEVPQFATKEDGFAAIEMVTIPFTKTNAGYSVACVAKWKTSVGSVITTPVLISSVSEYTDMETTATGFNLAKLNILHASMRFYMSFWDIVKEPGITSAVNVFDYTAEENPSLSLENVFKFIASTDYSEIRVINAPDPYEEEGAGSGEEGGDGEDLDDDEMGISHHAIPAAINTGFCRIYCPSEQQLRALSNFLWSAQYDLTAVKKLFANPMDSVLGLSAVPLTLSGANAAVYLGGVDTEMSFPMVSYQSYQIPMGAITVEKRWGSYLDYDPYTRFSIFLPFIGFKDLSADDIMGKQIILDYDVDILSGACTARLQAGGNVLYQWSGQCSIQLPVTASNWNQVFQGATSAALSAGLAVATGSAGPVLAGALAAEGVQAIMGKPRIERGGTASGAAGWMGGLTPYLVRVTPEAIIPSDQNKFIGYPAFSSISLGSLTGYNEIASIHLEGIPATGAELEELESILKGGVIF